MINGPPALLQSYMQCIRLKMSDTVYRERFPLVTAVIAGSEAMEDLH
jgi:hypothetical protein